MFQGEVRFGKSTVERTIKWDSDAEMQDIKRDTKMKMLKKHQMAGGKLRQSQSTSPQAYFKQKMMLQKKFEGNLSKMEKNIDLGLKTSRKEMETTSNSMSHARLNRNNSNHS